MGREQLSSRLANPHCVETPIVAEVERLGQAIQQAVSSADFRSSSEGDLPPRSEGEPPVQLERVNVEGSSMDFPIYNPIELQQGLTSGPFEGNWSKLIKLFMDVLEHEAPDLDRFGLAK